MAMRTKNAARKNHGLGAALAVVLWTLAAAGCGEGADVAPSEPFTAHGEASDFAPVILDVGKADALAAQFDANRLMAQNFFLATDLIDGPALQAFFEATPYGTRSWLADEQIADGTPVAAAIVAASRAAGVNPIVMVARMQVEKSLVSATVRPRRAHDVDFAFGCGCPDGQSCAEVYRGLDRQIECAATTLRRLHDGSVAGTAQWRAGHPRKTLDPVTVTPANHATAALYAYTPWVLEGRGGGWLVWNITRRYAQAFVAAGAFAMDDPRLADPFVGTPCATDRDCLFADGAALGFCLAHLPEAAEDDAPPVASGPWTPLGFCALPCEGYCPDRAGDAPTFCASLDGLIGLCLPNPTARTTTAGPFAEPSPLRWSGSWARVARPRGRARSAHPPTDAHRPRRAPVTAPPKCARKRHAGARSLRSTMPAGRTPIELNPSSLPKTVPTSKRSNESG